jgi:hypothetical protein
MNAWWGVGSAEEDFGFWKGGPNLLAVARIKNSRGIDGGSAGNPRSSTTWEKS